MLFSSTYAIAILVQMEELVIDVRKRSSFCMMTATPEATCAAANLCVA